MKVLLVARSFTRGGAATGASNLGLALEAAGLTVIRVSTSGKRRALRTVERAVERVLFDAETHCLRLGPPSVDIATEAARNRPDIVQFCDISANTIAPFEVARLPVPTVHRMSDFWPYHGPSHYAANPGDGSPLAKRLFAVGGFGALRPSARVAPSHWLADHVSGARPHVIPNAVTSPTVEARGPLREGPIRLGFISGKLNDPRKGLDRLITALQGLPEGLATLTAHGSGVVPVASVPVHNKGRFEASERAEVYRDIDILVCPSRYDNSPNTVTEALSHGVPVIGQTGTGMETYIDPKHGALLDFWGDAPPDLEGALSGIAARYPQASAAALHRTRTEFAPEVIGQAYTTLYETLLAARSP